MSSVRELHNHAMGFVDQAIRERARGKREFSLVLFRQALESELAAISELPEQTGLGWSILLRSAATMALDCEDFRMAEKLASKGLAGDPHPEVINELRDVWERANFNRHLELNGVGLSGLEVQLRLGGSDVVGSITSLPELVTRADSFQKLIYRIAQRKIDRVYRSRIPQSIQRSYRAYATAPMGEGFAIAIKLAHPREQGSFTDMLRTEEIIVEFMDLMETAEGAHVDELKARIPDPAYRRNFIGLGRKLAPDGDRIRRVGFTLVNGRVKRSLSVTTPASQFLSLQADSPSRSGEAPVEVSGTLKVADASNLTSDSNRIRLVCDDESHYDVSVPAGLMDDIVRPMWNSHVTVRGSLRLRQRVIRLHEIWESDPESGKSRSRLSVVSDASGGLQQSLPLP